MVCIGCLDVECAAALRGRCGITMIRAEGNHSLRYSRGAEGGDPLVVSFALTFYHVIEQMWILDSLLSFSISPM